MKKTIKAIIAVCFVFCLILAFTACYNQCSHTYDNSCDSKCNVCGSIRATAHTPDADDDDCTTDIRCRNCDKTAKSGNQNHVDTDGDYICDNAGCQITVGTPPEENAKDDITDALVKIEARPDFAFRYDLTNSANGEASPIESDYYLSAYKVTNAQYAVFVSETGRKAPSYWKNGAYPEGKADHPVLNVSYSDAAAYCEWLSEKYDDWSFRLPTEAEWENAAMGEYYNNSTVKYPIGNEIPSYDSTTTSPQPLNPTLRSR